MDIEKTLEILKLKLNLNNPYNVGIYVSSITLILSFVILPQQIDVKWLRSSAISLLILSVIARSIADIINAFANFEDKNHDLSYNDKMGYSAAHIFVFIVYFVFVVLKLTIF